MDFSLVNHKNWCFRDKDTYDHRMEYDIQFSDDSNSKTSFEAIINSKFGYTPFQEKLNTTKHTNDGWFLNGFSAAGPFVSHSARTLQDWSRTNWLQDSLEVKFRCVPSVSLHALLVYPYRMWFTARTWLYSTICLTSSIHLVIFHFIWDDDSKRLIFWELKQRITYPNGCHSVQARERQLSVPSCATLMAKSKRTGGLISKTRKISQEETAELSCNL